MSPFALPTKNQEKLIAAVTLVLRDGAKARRKELKARARANRNKPALWPEDQYAKKRKNRQSTPNPERQPQLPCKSE